MPRIITKVTLVEEADDYEEYKNRAELKKQDKPKGKEEYDDPYKANTDELSFTPKGLCDFKFIQDGLSSAELKLRLRLEMAMREHWISSKRFLSHLNNKRKLRDEDYETVEDRVPTWQQVLSVRNARIEELRKRIERGFK